MVKVFSCVYINQNENEHIGTAVVVLEDDGKIVGRDFAGGKLEGSATLDEDTMVIHVNSTVPKGFISVPNPDFGEMDGTTEFPVLTGIPKDMKVDDIHDTTLEGGGAPTNLQITRVY